MSTIFTKIIEGEIPSFKVYEDDLVCAFLDAFPQQKWHTLIIPKVEVDHFSDVSEPYFSRIFTVAQTLSKALSDATGAKRISLRIEGFEVPHCHIHLIPTNSASDAEFHKTERAPDESLAAMQKRILESLASYE